MGEAPHGAVGMGTCGLAPGSGDGRTLSSCLISPLNGQLGKLRPRGHIGFPDMEAEPRLSPAQPASVLAGGLSSVSPQPTHVALEATSRGRDVHFPWLPTASPLSLGVFCPRLQEEKAGPGGLD